MSEMKKKVLQSLIKQMHGIMAKGDSEEPLKKSSLSDAMEEAKEEALEDPKEEAAESPDDEAAEVDADEVVKPKKKRVSTISMLAIQRGAAAQAPTPSKPSPFKKK